MPKHKPKYSRIAQLKTAEEFTNYLNINEIILPFNPQLNEGYSEIFGQQHVLKNGQIIGNSFCILPMEGWDGTKDGQPTAHTINRWKKFGQSGAKLLFGGEAVAISHDAKANPNQLVMNEENFESIKNILEVCRAEHKALYGDDSDLYIGLQLTHSGRFCKPVSSHHFEPKVVYSHPYLDAKFKVNPETDVQTDEQIDGIIEKYIACAKLAQKAGFQFVDVKHCHGYLGHEMLSGIDRPGKYGGSLENRTRYMRSIMEGIKQEVPGMGIAIRISATDFIPFKKGKEDQGEPMDILDKNYPYAFGNDQTGMGIDLTETIEVLKIAEQLGVELVCVTAGSPYYNPHITRPALFPPSDGYLPPEEPLVGVARHIHVTAELKKALPNLKMVGSGYSYLQEWLPNVAQPVLEQNMADFIGLGRMVLSYPTMPADILAEKNLQRGLICRSFSDCTTAPRNGMISGCFPLDPYYKNLPEYAEFKELKAKIDN